MDQVRKLYEELVGYDPSLQNNKEAVLQVIEKMIAAKPMIVANPSWKDKFGEQLAEHIAMNKSKALVKPIFSFSLTRRGFSFATFFVVMVVAGAAYRGIQMDVVKDRKNIALKNNAHIKSDVDTNGMDDNHAEVSNQVEGQTSMGDERQVQEPDNAMYQNSTFALRNTNTMHATDIIHAPEIRPSIEISTDVDISTLGKNVTPMVGGTGGATAETMVAYDDLKNSARVEGSVGVDAAVPPSADLANSAMVAPAAHVEQKSVALVFVHDFSLPGESIVDDLLKQYAVPATFVEAGNEEAIRVKAIGSSDTISYVDLRNSSLATTKTSMQKSHIIVLNKSDITKNPAKLTMLIEKLQAEGYSFVTISAIQK